MPGLSVAEMAKGGETGAGEAWTSGRDFAMVTLTVRFLESRWKAATFSPALEGWAVLTAFGNSFLCPSSQKFPLGVPALGLLML